MRKSDDGVGRGGAFVHLPKNHGAEVKIALLLVLVSFVL